MTSMIQQNLLKSAEYTDAMDHAGSIKRQVVALDQQIRNRYSQ